MGVYLGHRVKEVVDLPIAIQNFQWTVSKERERFLVLVNSADIAEATNEDDDATPEPTHLKVVYNGFTELNELEPLGRE